MHDPHAPSPEFTRFLEWQTRTELRRRERFQGPPARLPAVARLTRLAALVLFSVVIGGGAVFAAERLQESRQLEVLLQRNQLLGQLAASRVDGALEVAERLRVLHEQGVVPQDEISEAERRVAELERDRDRLRLEGEEMGATRRAVDRRLSAPRVGSRDFVAERLGLERAYAGRVLDLREADEELALVRFESGIVSQAELRRTRRAADAARAEVERFDERLALRADFVGGRVDAETCEALDLIGDAERRRRALITEAEHVRAELSYAEQLEDAGLGSNLGAPLRSELESLEVDIRLVDLELELLR